MTGRRALVAFAVMLMPGPAGAQSRSAQRRHRRQEPLPLPPPEPPPEPVWRGDPAPVPNADIEIPRSLRAGEPTPRIDPALIDPNEPRVGATSDPHSPQAREDRLLRNPAPGARLRVPFSY